MRVNEQQRQMNAMQSPHQQDNNYFTSFVMVIGEQAFKC
jgi:hypothetical protein